MWNKKKKGTVVYNKSEADIKHLYNKIDELEKRVVKLENPFLFEIGDVVSQDHKVYPGGLSKGIVIERTLESRSEPFSYGGPNCGYTNVIRWYNIYKVYIEDKKYTASYREAELIHYSPKNSKPRPL